MPTAAARATRTAGHCARRRRQLPRLAEFVDRLLVRTGGGERGRRLDHESDPPSGTAPGRVTGHEVPISNVVHETFTVGG
jgi:hypothetical protein